jgi:hypothetical protein
MSKLTKSEYQILLHFYEFNQALTKSELLAVRPELNSNTTAAVIRSLLRKGYLEVNEIKYSQTVLTRAYKPCISFYLFLQNVYGKHSVDQLVKQTIGSIRDSQQLELFLKQINKRKNDFE